MSTRTAIDFGAILESSAQARLSHFERFYTDSTSQYLLYGYRRILTGGIRAFVLVQASRRAGKVAFEVAVGRQDTYPFHRLKAHPVLGMAGFRERLGILNRGLDHSDEYRTGDQLGKIIREAFSGVDSAVNRMLERALPHINDGYRTWQPIYEEWVQLEASASARPPHRYPSLPDEGTALEVLEDFLGRSVFDRYLGPLKFRYRQPDFFHCHLYMLARGLEIIEPPTLEPPPEPETKLVPGQQSQGKALGEPLDDPIAAMTGRVPQEYSVELSYSTGVRGTEFAFLRSLGAVEALLQLDESGRPLLPEQSVPESGPPGSSAPSRTFQLEKPSYALPASSSRAEASKKSEPTPEPVAAPPPKQDDSTPVPAATVLDDDDDDDDDPLKALERRFGLS